MTTTNEQTTAANPLHRTQAKNRNIPALAAAGEGRQRQAAEDNRSGQESLRTPQDKTLAAAAALRQGSKTAQVLALLSIYQRYIYIKDGLTASGDTARDRGPDRGTIEIRGDVQ